MREETYSTEKQDTLGRKGDSSLLSTLLLTSKLPNGVYAQNFNPFTNL